MSVTGKAEVILEGLGTVCALVLGDPGCKHQWGQATQYKDRRLGKDGTHKRTDTRERKACTKCGGVEDTLVSMEHIGGQLEL